MVKVDSNTLKMLKVSIPMPNWAEIKNRWSYATVAIRGVGSKIPAPELARIQSSKAKTPNFYYDPNGFQAKRMSAVKLVGFCHIPK